MAWAWPVVAWTWQLPWVQVQPWLRTTTLVPMIKIPSGQNHSLQSHREAGVLTISVFPQCWDWIAISPQKNPCWLAFRDQDLWNTYLGMQGSHLSDGTRPRWGVHEMGELIHICGCNCLFIYLPLLFHLFWLVLISSEDLDLVTSSRKPSLISPTVGSFLRYMFSKNGALFRAQLADTQVCEIGPDVWCPLLDWRLTGVPHCISRAHDSGSVKIAVNEWMTEWMTEWMNAILHAQVVEGATVKGWALPFHMASM